MDDAIWLPIEGFPRYFVSDQGQVRGPQKLLAPKPNSKGYLRVTLHPGFVYRTVHQLVLEAFVGPKPEGMETRHLNGDPADNRLINLKWGTTAENAEDLAAHGKRRRGETHMTAKLTEADVLEIRRLYATGLTTQEQLALAYGVNQSRISAIIRRASWGHV